MAGLDYIRAPDIGADRTAYVSPDFHTDTFKHTFTKIQDAIDWAYSQWGAIGVNDSEVLILIYPGIYTEQIHSYAGYNIQGFTHEATSDQQTAVLYNTGIDADHYPLRGGDDDYYYMSAITIRTDAGEVIGKIGTSHFNDVIFSKGHFIEATDNKTLFPQFDGCSFRESMAFNLSGIGTGGSRIMTINNCFFAPHTTHWRFDSTHTTTLLIIKNTIFHRFYPDIGGNWKVEVSNCHTFGSSRTVISTTNKITYIQCIISNGFHFTSDPDTIMQLCTFNDDCGYPISGADITSDVDVTNVSYVQNVQQNGISGKIQIVSDVVNVGGDSVNRYYSIQDAIDSLPSGGVISLQPGTYTEQIHSTGNILIQGRTHEGVPAVKSTILYNTGVDSAHYPLGGDDTDIFNISDITIKTDADAVIGKLSASNFTGVVFQNGYFIESTANQAMLMGLADCSFEDSMAFNLTGVGSGGMRAMTIIGCYFNDYATHWKMDSTHTNTLVIVKNSIFHNFYPDVGGNWKVEYSNSHIFGTSRSIISTTNRIAYIQCITSNGLHFTSNPDVIMHLCTFNDDCGYAITGADITADVIVTGVDYVQNVQQNGISGKIQTAGDVINVGGDSVNRYYSIQDAIDSLPSGGVISLQPGTYTEQIHSTANILIQGRTHEGVPAIKSTILYNTGADSDHYPLGGDDTDVFNISDITIKTDADKVIGKLSASNFTGVVFQNGYFIEATANQAMLMGLADCSFEDSMAFNLTGVGSGGLRAMTINGCYFNDYATHWVMDSTHTDTLVIVKNTIFHKFYPDIGGNWGVEISNSHCFGTSRSVISTTNKIAYIQCILSNGLHFTADPTSTTIQLSTFNDDCGYTITGEDITADVEVTGVSYVQNVQQNGISGKIHTASDVVNVGNDSVCRYYSIQDAIDSLTSGGLIFISPGTYTEQIHSKANITLQGYTTEGPPSKKSTILYNTGADAAHYPLGGDDTDYYVINDITIETDAGGVIGKIDSHKFSGCVFSKGHFIEATKNADMLMGFDNCTFIESQAFNFTDVGTGGLRAMTINGCFFSDHATHWVMNSTHDSTLVIVKNCICHRSYMDIGGNWQVEISDCHLMGTSRSIISTTNKITFIKCILANGLHFTSNPDTIIQLCTFNDDCGYPITGADITASLEVTSVDYAQNVQQNGLAGEIHILDPIKPVGGDAVNRYYSIQDAIDSIITSGIVELHASYTGLAELTIPNNTKVTIDGRRVYSLAFTADIVELGLNEKLILNNISEITGVNVEINGNGAEFHMHSCPCGSNLMQILATSGTGSKVHLRNTNLMGATGCSPLQINSLDPEYLMSYSRLVGSTGQPAIEYTVLASSKLRSRFSTFVHGDGGTNAPLIYIGAGKVTFSMYSCGLNAAWSPAGFTNAIGSANNTTDPNIDF